MKQEHAEVLRAFVVGSIFGPLLFLVLYGIDKLLLRVPAHIADRIDSVLFHLYPSTKILDLVLKVSSSTVLAWVWTMLIFAVYYGAIFVCLHEAYRSFIVRRR